MLWISLVVSLISFIFNLFVYVSNLYGYCMFKFSRHGGGYEIGFKRYGYNAMIALVVAVISFILLSIILDRVKEEIEETVIELVAIQEKSDIKGEGSLFCISIHTDDVYTYYYKLGNGGYKKGKVVAKNTTIFEEDTNTPRMVVYKTTRMNTTWIENFLTFKFFKEEKEEYEIHVPKGTVVCKDS